MGRDKEFTRKLNSLSKVRGQFLKNNYDDFLQSLEKLKETLNDPSNPSLTVSSELNRMFYNYINCYYQLEQLEDEILELIPPTHRLNINKKKKDILDEERKYFVKGLRGYYTHINTGDICLTDYTNENAKLTLSKSNDLLNNFDIKGFTKATSYSERFNENIPIESEVKEFHNSVLLYYDWLQNELRKYN